MTKQKLSPAAQAVWEAGVEQAECPNDAEWVVINALRAAACEVVPVPIAYQTPYANWVALGIKNRLLAIADELEETLP